MGTHDGREHRPRSGRRRIGPLEIDILARQAWVAGRPVKLSKTEFGLLQALAADPTRVFTKVNQGSHGVVRRGSRRTPGSPGRQSLSSSLNEAAGQDK